MLLLSSKMKIIRENIAELVRAERDSVATSL